jgi:signal transduction histidine kinase
MAAPICECVVVPPIHHHPDPAGPHAKQHRRETGQVATLELPAVAASVSRALEAAFPFHAVVESTDHGLVVVDCGWLLRRAAGDLVGKPFPLAAETPGDDGREATVRVGLPGLALEGPLVTIGRARQVFLGVPVIRDAVDLADHADGWADEPDLRREIAQMRARLEKETADRQRMELELRLAQKLEAVGQLAAGIAHEINTPVQYVSDSVHFLRGAFDDVRKLLELYRARVGPETFAAEEIAADLPYLEAQIPRAFERVLDGTGRVAAIVRAMKDFARPDQREMAPADLNKAILSTLTVCRSEYRYHAVVETDLAELPPVSCHIGDLNQVFLNLVVNAAHAIADAGRSAEAGGRIRVRTAADGDDVIIEVADSGCGIIPEVASRVFDPFYTTKEVGRGTGQGLAISRSIVVDKHQGTLTFTTEPGRGTTFRVRLPIAGRGAPAR